MSPEYYHYPKLDLTVRLTSRLDRRLISLGSPPGIAHRLAVEAGYVPDSAGLPLPWQATPNALPIDPDPLILLLP